MKYTLLISMGAVSLLAALAIPVRLAAQEQNPEFARYTLTDLGPVGGAPGQPVTIAKNGLISGSAATSDGTVHAFLWYKGLQADIGTPGLGGSNSVAFGDNEKFRAVGEAETT